MRLFYLERDEDVSGVSGVGRVAEGVVFSNGRAIINWLTDKSSIVFWERFEDAVAIHGHGGKTRFVFPEEAPHP